MSGYQGSLARELKVRGELIDFAIEELTDLLATDSLSGGSISYVLPGHASAG